MEMLVALTEVLLGAALALVNTWVGGALAAVGLVRVGLRLASGRRRRRRTTVHRPTPALQLDPRPTLIELVEKVSGTQRLDEHGTTNSVVTSVTGEVRAELSWARAHGGRVAEHRRRHQLFPNEDVRIIAGALVLRGPARLSLTDPEAGPQLPVLLLETIASKHTVLAHPSGAGNPQWTCTEPYALDEPVLGTSMPVWVTLAAAPGSGGRTLDVDVQWRLGEPDYMNVETDIAPVARRLETLRLVVPAIWGEVLGASRAEQVVVSPPEAGWRVVEFSRPPVEKESRGRCHLSIAFERRILDRGPDTPTEITGTLRMAFEHTLSGATGLQLHATGGARRQDGARGKVRTEAELDLQLDLRSLRYQEVRAVPDPSRDVEQRREHRDFPEVAPDHYMVTLLTRLLSDQGYYVKRVVENPAQAGKRAGVLNRFWDIAGRRYNGAHPVDFHLVLTGEEAAPGSDIPSMTTARLNVRGSYANAGMEQMILDEQHALWARIEAGLTHRGLDEVRTRSAGQPLDAAGAEVARLRGAAITLARLIREAATAGEMAVTMGAELTARIEDEFEVGALDT